MVISMCSDSSDCFFSWEELAIVYSCRETMMDGENWKDREKDKCLRTHYVPLVLFKLSITFCLVFLLL